jgi:polar amino acid transport system substrate-binding protein
MVETLSGTLSRRSFLGYLGLAAGSLSIGGLLEACGSQGGTSTEDTLAKIQRTKYALLSSYNQAAHGWFSAGDGKWHGMDVDIVEYILPKIGVTKWDYIVNDWSGMIPGLLAKRWDFMSIGMSIFPTRQQVVDFSEPPYRSGSAIVVLAGNPKNITGKPSYAGHRIGAVLGAGELDDIKSVSGATAVPYKTAADMFADIKAGRIDACEMDEGEAGYDFSQSPDPALQVLHQWEGKQWDYAGLVFRKEDTRLSSTFNTYIKQMKSDGTMLAIIEKYGFGTDNMVPVPCTLQPMPGSNNVQCAA